MTKPIIPVTKPYLPSREKLDRYIDGIYERNWLTNNGPLVQELTHRLEEYLGVENLLLVANGTLALQIAYRTLGINEPINGKPAEAITTPFTFIATASSLKWEGIQPVFVDIDPDTWNIDHNLIEAAITPETRALVPVHVFGNPCEVEEIQAIADKHQLKVIYDAAHAFGVKYRDESILKWGDAATLSFHATKVFHTIEGGAIVFKRKEDLEKAKKLINFGMSTSGSIDEVGINAKMNEFQAAVGLANLEKTNEVKQKRHEIWWKYKKALKPQQSAGQLVFQLERTASELNYSYFPVYFENRLRRENVERGLLQKGINTRRYFYPSLNKLKLFKTREKCTYSEQLTKSILCLPIYAELDSETQEEIIRESKKAGL